MRLQSLQLQHFRSFAQQALDFRGAGRHLFLGPNGSGKTNLLEAIGLLSLTKSLRGRDDEELVRWEADHYRVTGAIVDDAGASASLEIVSVLTPRRRKATFHNGVRTPLTQFIGLLPTVSFLPQDLLLFSGPPAARRAFLDELLCQVDPGFVTLHAGYQDVLQQRNALLRRIVQGHGRREDLAPWDAQLAEHGSRITLARLELLETLTMTFGEELRMLGERWSDANLRYARRTAERTQSAIALELQTLLAHSRERDLLLQATTVGPHREDWQVHLEGRPLPTFASRGQERTAVVALLLLEVSYLELRRDERPLLLLDDVFSELDDAHQEALLGALTDHQVFVTSTRMPVGLRGAQVWEVGEGMCRPQRTAVVLQ